MMALGMPLGVNPLNPMLSSFLISAAASAAVKRVYAILVRLFLLFFSSDGKLSAAKVMEKGDNAKGKGRKKKHRHKALALATLRGI